MAVEITNTTVLKPYDLTLCSNDLVPLTIFDLATFDHNVPIVYAFYAPAAPSNDVLINGLRGILALYPHLTGRKAVDNRGSPCIVLNGAGGRLVETRVHATLEEKMPLEETSKLSDLYPKMKGAPELFQVHLNRYACGGLVIGLSFHHRVVDGQSMSQFLAAWADMVRNPSSAPRTPDLDRSAACIPRNPPKCEFNHMETEFKVVPTTPRSTDARAAPKIANVVLHFSPETISDLKTKVPGRSSTFSNLLTHLWKKLTIVRGVEDYELTRVRIAVNGRARLRPPAPAELFGNMVLWAYPKMRASELARASHADIVGTIRDAVSRVDDGYFRSFVDFGGSVKSRDLVGSTTVPKLWSSLSPDLEVDSWLGFKFHELDFGGGGPCAFIPPDLPVEGLMVFVPSCNEGGGVDVFVAVLEDHVGPFKAVCYDMP